MWGEQASSMQPGLGALAPTSKQLWVALTFSGQGLHLSGLTMPFPWTPALAILILVSLGKVSIQNTLKSQKLTLLPHCTPPPPHPPTKTPIQVLPIPQGETGQVQQIRGFQPLFFGQFGLDNSFLKGLPCALQDISSIPGLFILLKWTTPSELQVTGCCHETQCGNPGSKKVPLHHSHGL